MKARIKKAIQSAFRLLNLKITRCPGDEFEMMDAVRRLAHRSVSFNTIIDLGASNGAWSLRVMEVFPQKNYVCIEPLVEHQQALEQLHSMYPHVMYIPCVAGERDGEMVTMDVSPDLDGSTVDGEGGEKRDVPVRSIDAIVTEKHLQGPFLIKFDTHGYEQKILHGALETLKQTELIIMEVYNFNITDNAIRFWEMCKLLEEYGFLCLDLASPLLRPKDKVFWQMDMVFARKEAPFFLSNQYEINSI